ncbi:GDSL esterase/lipase At2g04570 [Andrographis paniculata]|uniref:GDSL esterase/lipase At2g04570 n=1 Tax=Andrographis paniculata TaxID=175694 RepID=UPI0021E95A79|nr:GDSL esterase/lipase At2g04570 [Andrographis paniculata]
MIMESKSYSYILIFFLHIFLAHFLIHTTANIPAIIVFGDSSVDAGNNNHVPTIARSNFGPYGRDFAGGRPTGRFCNGRIATDFISEGVGLRPVVPAYLDPAYNMSDFSVGVTFASAGTGYDNATSDVLGVIPMWKELEYYKEYRSRLREHVGDFRALSTLVNALYVVSMGTNDFLENYYSTFSQRRMQYTVDEYEDFLIRLARNFVVEIHSLGAHKISLGGLPPMGCMPLERTQNIANGNECMETYNVVAESFNQKLEAMVGELNRDIPGLQLVFSNPYYVLRQIVDNPASYGFEVSERACCATGRFEMGFTCDERNPMTCRDANKYVFWDAFHPSEQTNRIVAQHLLNTSLHKFLIT